MEKDAIVLELSDGREVEVTEVWDCCDGEKDCGSVIEVIDCNTNLPIGRINGRLPDFDDEDFDMDSFISFIEYYL